MRSEFVKFKANGMVLATITALFHNTATMLAAWLMHRFAVGLEHTKGVPFGTPLDEGGP